MTKPIQLVDIFDLRDETDSMAVIVLASKADFQVLCGLLEAGEPEAYGGWSLAETGPHGEAAPEGLRYYYLYFDVNLEYLTATAVEVVKTILSKYL